VTYLNEDKKLFVFNKLYFAVE